MSTNAITINGHEFAEDHYTVFATQELADAALKTDSRENYLEQDDIKAGMTVYVLDEETETVEIIEVK